MKNYEEKIASLLLQSKAIILQPSNPFTWASGWKSPIYCDNRKTLSFPEIREYICNSLTEAVQELYPEAQVIAGVATGAIAQAALVADRLKLPMVYVRPEAKKHGLGNQVEGYLEKGKQVVVVEDLVSTGKSSLNAVEALRNEGANVAGMVAVFTYGFPEAVTNFKNANCSLFALGNYDALVNMAVSSGYIDTKYVETLGQWRKNPGAWLP